MCVCVCECVCVCVFLWRLSSPRILFFVIRLFRFYFLPAVADASPSLYPLRHPKHFPFLSLTKPYTFYFLLPHQKKKKKKKKNAVLLSGKLKWRGKVEKIEVTLRRRVRRRVWRRVRRIPNGEQKGGVKEESELEGADSFGEAARRFVIYTLCPACRFLVLVDYPSSPYPPFSFCISALSLLLMSSSSSSLGRSHCRNQWTVTGVACRALTTIKWGSTLCTHRVSAFLQFGLSLKQTHWGEDTGGFRGEGKHEGDVCTYSDHCGELRDLQKEKIRCIKTKKLR